MTKLRKIIPTGFNRLLFHRKTTGLGSGVIRNSFPLMSLARWVGVLAVLMMSVSAIAQPTFPPGPGSGTEVPLGPAEIAVAGSMLLTALWYRRKP